VHKEITENFTKFFLEDWFRGTIVENGEVKELGFGDGALKLES
jgi:hypothetical protein